MLCPGVKADIACYGSYSAHSDTRRHIHLHSRDSYALLTLAILWTSEEGQTYCRTKPLWLKYPVTFPRIM